MTNDLKLRKRLMLPEFHQDKVYEFECINDISNNDIISFNKGITIDKDVVCRPSKIELINNKHGYITIQEGKYHQIKKMFLSVNNKITRLHRVSIACIELGDLKEGTYRSLNEQEIKELKMIVKR